MDQASANELTVARGAGLIEAEADGELIGLHIGNGTCYAFNSTATRVWQLIEQPKSLAEICGVLGQEFDVDSATCEAEVRDLLDELARDGIVILRVSGP